MQKLIENNMRLKKYDIFKSWEFIIFIVLLAVLGFDYMVSPTLFTGLNLLDSSVTFMEKSLLALPLSLIIITGYLDISVASIVALSGTVLGVSFNSGMPMWLSIIMCLAVGTLAGLINGLLSVKLKIPSMVVSLAGLILYRGIALIFLGDSSVDLPEKFGLIGGAFNSAKFPIPIPFIIFIIVAIIFGVILQFTTIGREIYAIGNNEKAARYSGIQVDKIRISLYLAMGFICGLVGILLTSRISSVRPDIATGLEMQVITIILLGGVYITGGKGSILGVVISSFVIGYIFFGLSIKNIPSTVISVVTGVVLIVALVIPSIISSISESRRKKFYNIL